MTRALTHFFGSTDGYRTLARAPGVTDADDAALATLGFGSPRTQADFDALDREPCVAGRALPSGRFAITRVFAGAPDVAGRQTVERRTLILDARAWSDLLASDLTATLACPSIWARERFASGESVEFEAVPSDELLPEPGDDERRAFDALLEAQRTGRCATLPDEPRWRRALLRLGSFLPAERRVGLGWGVGLWAVPQGVWLATLRADAQPRHAMPARLSGAWLHPNSVERLGRDASERVVARRSLARPARARRAPPPWMIGSAVAALMVTIALWLTVGGARTSTPTTPAATETPEATTAIDPVASTPAPSADASPPTMGAAPPGTPEPAREIVSSAPPSPTEPSRVGESFRAASADRSFGSGDEAHDPSAPAAASAANPAVPSTAPAAPAPNPAPIAPAIPAPPPASTLWDDEVTLLTQSIDLADRVREVAARGAPDPEATLRAAEELVAQAAKLRVAALKVERASARSGGRGSERRIFYADQFQPGKSNEESGVSKSFVHALTLGAFPPELARQVALLAARFEIAQAAHALLASPLGESERVRATLRDEREADGWPAPNPFDQWLYHLQRGGAVTSQAAERHMADAFADKLAGLPGMSPLVKQLRRIAPLPPTTPAP